MWKDLSYFVYVKVLCMVCLKKMFSNKKKVLDIVAFLVKYMYVWNVHQNGQGIINKSV